MKKGFTLVELMGILVIVLLIGMIAIPNVMRTIKKANEDNYKQFAKNIEIAAERYIDKNKIILSEPGANIFIKINDLVESGLYNKNNTNPKTKEKVDLNSTVFVLVNNDYTKTYKYTYGETDIDKYIKDELVTHYDGYTKPGLENNNIVVKDLTNNNDGKLVNGSMQDYNDFRIKLGKDDNYIHAPRTDLITQADDVTIEIVYEIYDNTPSSIFYTQGYGLHYNVISKEDFARSMIRNSDNTANSWPRADNTGLSHMNKTLTFTTTIKKENDKIYVNYYANGNKLNTTNSEGQGYTNNDYKIGKSYTTDPSKVYIYSVRIYKKVLLEEEIANNYNIDKYRYGFINR